MSIGAISPSLKQLVYKFLGLLTSSIASLAWLATIVTLFALWAEDNFTRYEPDDGQVSYISTVGARHKTEFIIGTAITGTFFVLTLITTKLCFDLEDRRRFKRGVSITSIICGIIASISLLLLAIFDSINHQAAHYTFTGLFIVFTLLSAIFTIIYRFSHHEINLTVYLRVIFVSFVIPLAITFAIMTAIKRPDYETQLKSVAATIEWFIAILFVFYLALFTLDILLY
jgi:hypothetical protein